MVLEVAGTEKTFEMAWKCARPNAIVTVVALYDRPQTAAVTGYVWKKPDL